MPRTFKPQTALVVLSPDRVLVTVLDHFQLIGYFHSVQEHPMYNATQLGVIVKKLLYVLITPLAERTTAARLPLPAAIRCKIVHALAGRPASCTKLVKRIAERMVNNTCFKCVLRNVAHFRTPKDAANTINYKLCNTVLDKVNLFYHLYMWHSSLCRARLACTVAHWPRPRCHQVQSQPLAQLCTSSCAGLPSAPRCFLRLLRMRRRKARRWYLACSAHLSMQFPTPYTAAVLRWPVDTSSVAVLIKKQRCSLV